MVAGTEAEVEAAAAISIPIGGGTAWKPPTGRGQGAGVVDPGSGGIGGASGLPDFGGTPPAALGFACGPAGFFGAAALGFAAPSIAAGAATHASAGPP